MKLIIDIPETPLYKDICKNGYIYDEDNEYIAKVIANGIQLENIMSEMRVIKDKQDGVNNYRAGLKLALEIIDNHTYFLDKHIYELKGESNGDTQ